MGNRQRGNEATGQRVTLAMLAMLALLACLAAPAEGQTIDWQPEHPSHRHVSRVIDAWVENTTPSPIDVVLSDLEITYEKPLTLAVEQGVFWRTDHPSGHLADLILWTQLDDSLLPWAALPIEPWPWGEELAPWASTILMFTPGPVSELRFSAQFTLRPGETVVVGQFARSQALVLSTPEPATLALAAIGAAAVMRRTRRR